MKFPFINNPDTGKPDEMVTITILSVGAVLTRFLFDGITVSMYGHSFTFGHVDAMVYASILAPILGTHGFITNNKDKKDGNQPKN